MSDFSGSKGDGDLSTVCIYTTTVSGVRNEETKAAICQVRHHFVVG